MAPGLVALAVGLAGIGVPELWRDEVSSWSAAGRPLRGLFAMLANVDASNGASYVLLHAWTGLFGDSPAALRLPSALAIAGAACFTALIARRMFASPVAGLAGGLLLATVPQISRYAQEARAYAVVACAVAAATWLLLRALERPTADRWAWYALATGVAGVFHLVSLACLVGQLPMVAAAALRPDARRVLRQWPLAVAAGVAPALPVMALGRLQSGRQLSWLAAPTVRDLRFVWQDLFGSHQVLYAFLAMALPPCCCAAPGARPRCCCSRPRSRSARCGWCRGSAAPPSSWRATCSSRCRSGRPSPAAGSAPWPRCSA
ncbi:glycosyltransferase family 39 protein [Kitasatospora arboriphila]